MYSSYLCLARAIAVSTIVVGPFPILLVIGLCHVSVPPAEAALSSINETGLVAI